MTVSTMAADVQDLKWLADQLRIGISTAYRHAEELPGVFRVGRQYRVSVPAFNRQVHGASS
jgi:hypothetical protein